MTRRPICPECRSDQIVPDVTNGGAGRNRCAACNHVGAVRDFYPEPLPGHALVEHYADKLRDHLREHPVSFANFMQEPVFDPPGYRTDPKTGNLRPAKYWELHPDERPVRTIADDPAPRRNPAPIRQYKDD